MLDIASRPDFEQSADQNFGVKMLLNLAGLMLFLLFYSDAQSQE